MAHSLVARGSNQKRPTSPSVEHSSSERYKRNGLDCRRARWLMHAYSLSSVDAPVSHTGLVGHVQGAESISATIRSIRPCFSSSHLCSSLTASNILQGYLLMVTVTKCNFDARGCGAPYNECGRIANRRLQCTLQIGALTKDSLTTLQWPQTLASGIVVGEKIVRDDAKASTGAKLLPPCVTFKRCLEALFAICTNQICWTG